MSDAEDFLEEAANFVPKDRSRNQIAPRDEIPTEDGEEGMAEGKLVQYSANGEGYTPTPKTIGALPGGIYSIEHINHLLTYIPRNVKTDKLMRLPDSRSDEVIGRIKKFWTLKDEFANGNEKAEGGYLHKLGIMLFGPPGSGKTSTVKFIMEDIIQRGGIVILGDGHPATLASGLKSFRSVEPERPVVVVFEDFDELVAKYSESPYLSMLDGEDSIDNSLFMATTNYPSRLDPRMYNRPGRFSDVIKIGMPSEEARRIYLNTKLKDKSDVDKIIPMTENFSLDHLKALILGVYFEGRDLDGEIKRLKTLFRPPKDDNNEGKGMGIGQ